MTYKQRNLLSFVLVSIVEHAKEPVSVLVCVIVLRSKQGSMSVL